MHIANEWADPAFLVVGLKLREVGAVPPEGGVAEPAVRDVYRWLAYGCKAPERTVSAPPWAAAPLQP